jgi:[ribosomal protein S18]-alanine N-acetyltransferase
VSIAGSGSGRAEERSERSPDSVEQSGTEATASEHRRPVRVEERSEHSPDTAEQSGTEATASEHRRPVRVEERSERGGEQSGAAMTLEALDWWDIPVLVELETVLFDGDSPWSAEMFWTELAEGNHYVVHRDAAGTIDGYAGVALAGDDAEVRTIGVRPSRQGRGIGRVLLRDLISAAGGRRILLEVRTDNEAAIALYESEGFRRLGLRRRYYQPSGADAFTMARPA